MKKEKIIIVILLVLSSSAIAQEIVSLNMGADVLSRYVWRGLDFGGTPVIQPAVTLSFGGFELGVWGSTSLSTEKIETDEFDVWASYTFDPGFGNVSLIFTDYYFPNAGFGYGNFNNYDDPEGPGGHTLELGVSYAGNDSFPISVSGFMNIYNEEGNSTYLELSYSTSLSDIDCTLVLGATTGNKSNPGYYGSESFAIINSGFQFTKNIQLTEKFALPLSLSVLYNPNIQLTHLVIGVSL